MDLSTWIWEKVESDASLPEDAQYLVLAAVEGDEAFAAHVGGKRVSVPQRVAETPVPQRAFLKGLQVEGYRGIGRPAQISFSPHPGLVVVAGRNGSGKSTFAEALDWALNQATSRASKTSVLWKDQWRNLHHAEPAGLRAAFVIEGRGETTVGIDWPAGADSDGFRAWTQDHGKPRQAGTAALGWAEPLELYSPMLSYDELGGIFESKPSALYDALERFLGLERLTQANKRLHDHFSVLDGPRREADALRKQAKTALQDLDDARAATALSALKPRVPSDEVFAALDDVLAGSTTYVEPHLAALQTIVTYSLPPADHVVLAAQDLSSADQAVRNALEEAISSHALRANLLQEALEFHGAHGDGPCPVCGLGTLNADWRRQAAQEVEVGRDKAERLDRAKRAREDAQSRWSRFNPSPPSYPDETDLDLPSLGPVKQAWTAWSQIADSVAGASTDTIASSYETLLKTHAMVRDEAEREAARRRDLWLEVLPVVARWRDLHKEINKTANRRQTAKQADEWLKDRISELRAERLAPLADQARQIWCKLRQESNVDLGSITLEGSSTRRRVDLRGSVDGAEVGTLAVMSQGELHALGLALFIPRACATESPFGFLVLDDPIQAMDPAKIDGFVDVLAEISQLRQVIVFSHDDRLPECLRRLSVPARIVEIVRGAESHITVRSLSDPVSRYLDDAHAITRDPAVAPVDQRRVIPGLCRMALEAACQEIVYARELSMGRRRVDVESDWSRTRTTSERLQAALRRDSGAVGTWLQTRPRARRGLGICTSGFHKGLQDMDPVAAVDAVRALIEEL